MQLAGLLILQFIRKLVNGSKGSLSHFLKTESLHLRDVAREELFITTKVWIQNVLYEGVMDSCQGSLDRIKNKMFYQISTGSSRQ